MIIFACDLDNTLIHSYKKAQKDDICVEKKASKELSFMSKEAYLKLQDIKDKVIFIPVTTRSIEQYRRIKLFENSFPQYAITSNGGNLIINNEIDEFWHKQSKDFIKQYYTHLSKGKLILENDKNICFEIRLVDDMFVFSKTNNIEETLYHLNRNLDMDKVSIFNNGNKVYIVPKILTKGFALNRIKRLLNIDFVVSAGDSIFDIPMLEQSNFAIVPDCEFKQQVCGLNQKNIVFNDKNIRFADFLLDKVCDYI